MGLLGFLEFALKCVDFLAWPLCSLGYPLYASIRAIESDSKSCMRNLVAYWILFSLISFFELAFGKLLEWLPFWFYIKLMTVCFLVLPQFDGACYAYEQLVRPCLSFNLEVVVKKFTETKKDTSVNAETFLAVAEKYVKENGLEELEKLVAQKSNDAKPSVDMEVIKAVTNTEEKEIAGEIHVKRVEQNVAETGPKAAAAVEKIKQEKVGAEDKATDVMRVEPNVTETGPKAAAAEKIKQETVGVQDNARGAPTSDKVQKEWACALCLVTTTSEKTLNSHLKGSKHKARYQDLIASKQGPKSKDPSSSTPNQEPKKPNPGDNANKNKTKNRKAKLEEIDKQKQKAQEPKKSNSGDTANPNKTKKQEKVEAKRTYEQGKKKDNTPFCCATCNVHCPSEKHLVSHLLGKKHMAQVLAKSDSELFLFNDVGSTTQRPL